MKKQLLLVIMVLILFINPTVAQQFTISGRVTEHDVGTPLPGVSILIKGTNNGTITDADGRYSLAVRPENTLIYSFVGFVTEEIVVGDQTVIDLTMMPDIEQLQEVVVTALGISREKKSLTYATQEISGEELTDVKDANFVNSITGKAAGVFVNRSGSGIGGSTRVVLRGNNSTRNNNVLYVIDGIPMNNFSPSQPNDVFGQSVDGDTGGAGRDGGDAISNLNPDDIESISVLKGASAAALYGSQAVNGVILITTKKGKAGQTQVNFSSNFTVESVLVSPDLQYRYGQTAPDALDSWGGSVNAEDHVDDFFETGRTWINSISLSGGSETAQTYFSYAHTDSKGIIPTSTFEKHNFNFTETANFFDNRLNLGANINLIVQNADNRPVSGLYFNPLTGLYLFPRGLDFNEYKENFEVFSTERNLYAQNWTADKDDQQNPYWILNRNQNTDQRSRYVANVYASLQLTDWLQLKARGSIDQSFDDYEQKAYATTQSTLADYNGRYVVQRTEATQYYGDVMLMANKQFDQWSINASTGAIIIDKSSRFDLFDSKGAYEDPLLGEVIGLTYPNAFSLQAMAPGATLSTTGTEEQLQSVFASVNLGYKNVLFLDVTGRNDWSSTLAFTSSTSFFYPSVGLTGIISEMTNLPGAINLLKLRASYAEVGSGVNPFDTNPLNQVRGLLIETPPLFRPRPGEELKPELARSYEVGTEIGVLGNKLILDLTYYHATTENQRVSILAPAGSGGGRYLINAGEIVNKGIEAAFTASLLQGKALQWDATINYTRNVNTVESLTEFLDEDEYLLTEPGVNNYAMVIREGGSFGDIYGKRFDRDEEGRIIVDNEGKPQATNSGLEYVGNPNPDFMIGFNNTFTYKGVTLKLLVDGRFGGEVMSITQAMMDQLGVSEETAEARDQGGVSVNAVRSDGGVVTEPIDARVFYSAVGGRAGITENYMYDATNIRLRELSIGYQLPSSIVSKLGPVKNARVSLVGRNLFFFTNEAPFDPDVSMSTGTGLQGVDVFAPPATRSLGFNLSLSL